MFRLDDIVAALILTLCMMRRLEVLGAGYEQNAHVRQADFEAWRDGSIAAYNLCAIACVVKVLLSAGWFILAAPPPWLQIGGAAIFVGWVVAMVVAWRRTTEWGIRRRELRIETRRTKRAAPDADRVSRARGEDP